MADFGTSFLILSAVTGAVSSVQQGRAMAAESRRAAQASKIDAQSKEIARRRNLLKTLAAQNNMAGVSGLTPNEGFQVIQENDLKWYDLDTQTAKVEQQVTQETYAARGRNALRTGGLGAAGTAAKAGWQYSLID